MISLSAVIITHNEEKNIARCLTSVRGLADEIVVVDSFSNDKTREICGAFNVKFVQHTFEGHIQQKNFAIKQAGSPYVLSLDADEALSEELKGSINKVKTAWDHDGYSMNRLTNYCGNWIHHSGWYPDRKTRLFDTRKGVWSGENPHDRYELTDPLSQVGFLKGDILHFSYYTVSDHIRQVDYFTGISARHLHDKGKNVSIGRMLLAPFVRFLRDYFLKLGILDGYAGLVVCTISAHAVFLKYAKLRQFYDKQ